MSTESASKPDKRRSMADYEIRYDLASLLKEAQADYSESAAGEPRHLAQADIAARFRRNRPRPPS